MGGGFMEVNVGGVGGIGEVEEIMVETLEM